MKEVTLINTSVVYGGKGTRILLGDEEIQNSVLEAEILPMTVGTPPLVRLTFLLDRADISKGTASA